MADERTPLLDLAYSTSTLMHRVRAEWRRTKDPVEQARFERAWNHLLATSTELEALAGMD